MMAIRAFAPGKLFVVGEYAVLAGGRALLAAIGPGIECRATPSAVWSIDAPDLGFVGTLEAAASHPSARLLAGAVTAGARRLRLDRPLCLRVEGAGRSRAKHGLGGSAASVAAVVGALAAAGGEDPSNPATRRGIVTIATEAHREHQNGRGSGADVAASVCGGWVDFRVLDGRPRIAPAAVPPALALAAVWSGIACDTATAIRSLPGGAWLDALRPPLDRFWQALERDDRTMLLESVCAYGDALGYGSGVGVARVRALVDAARAAGAAAKGSGAVGGDCVIAAGFEPTSLDGARRSWREAGGALIDVRVDPHGLRAEVVHG